MPFVRKVDRPKPWLAVYQDPDGRERSRSFLRKGDAERFLVSMETSMARGEWTDPRLGRTTVEAWGQRVLSTRHALPSHERDESLFRNHIVPHLGSWPLASLTPIDLREWVAQLSEKELSPATVNKIRGILSLILDAAVDSHYLTRNPVKTVKPPKAKPSEERFLSLTEVEALADAIGERWRPMVLLGAYCGLRFGEVGALRVGDLDLEAGVLTVSGTLRRRGGSFYRHPDPKTQAGRRRVTIPPSLTEILDAYPLADDLDALVFTDPGGGTVNANNWRKRVWAPAVAASVGEPCRFHHLRHSQASLAVALGVHPKLMAARLGHASTRVTERYSHAYEELDRRVAEVLDSLRVEFLTEQGRNKSPQTVVALESRREKRPRDQGL